MRNTRGKKNKEEEGERGSGSGMLIIRDHGHTCLLGRKRRTTGGMVEGTSVEGTSFDGAIVVDTSVLKKIEVCMVEGMSVDHVEGATVVDASIEVAAVVDTSEN